MIVNGKEITIEIEKEKEMSVGQFLKEHGYDITKVAVEKNGVIVPKNKFDAEKLLNSDKIEIVNFVGGG